MLEKCKMKMKFLCVERGYLAWEGMLKSQKVAVYPKLLVSFVVYYYN